MDNNVKTRVGYIFIPGNAIYNLNLKGVELLVYSLINGFTRKKNAKYCATLQEIADCLNISTAAVHKALVRLIDKGLIVKEPHNRVRQISFYYVANRNADK